MRRLLVVLVVLVGLLAVLDRVASYASAQVLAGQIKSSQHLATKPGVALRGFPFFTQVARGKYDEVDASVHGLTQDGLRLQEVDIQAHGVHVAFSDVVHGTVRQVPVDRGVATVHVAYADLNAFLARRADGIPSVSFDGDGRLRVHGRLSAFGITVTPSLEAAVSVSDDTLRVLPLAGAISGLPSVVQGLARSALTLTVPITGLPFGLHLRDGTVTAGGVVLTAVATGAVFPVHG